MKAKEFILPNVFKLNPCLNLQDIDELLKQLKRILKTYIDNCDSLPSYKNTNINKFRKYAIIQYIKHIDINYYYPKNSDYESNFTVGIDYIKPDLFDFINECLAPYYKITIRALDQSLVYLTKNNYLLIEDRELEYEDGKFKLEETYTCNSNSMTALQYLSKTYCYDLFETTELTMLLTTKANSNVESIIKSIKESYPNDLVSCEFISDNKPTNGYNGAHSYLRIICKKNSELHNDFLNRKKLNDSKGRRYQQKK